MHVMLLLQVLRAQAGATYFITPEAALRTPPAQGIACTRGILTMRVWPGFPKNEVAQCDFGG